MSCLEIAINQNPPYNKVMGPIPAPLSATECRMIQRKRNKLNETPSVGVHTQPADTRSIKVQSVLESRQA